MYINNKQFVKCNKPSKANMTLTDEFLKMKQ